MVKLAGIDVGNDSVKVITEGMQQPIAIPNIIAPGFERLVLQEEDAPIKALDVTIHSSALFKNNQRYFVGLLAMESEDNFELEESDNKAVSDQSLIVALTALAYVGLMGQSTYGSGDEIEYILGTGLPVRTYARFHKQFEDRLIGEHEVTFLSTPQYRNRKIKLIIRRTIMSIEGAGAIFNLATDENLQVRDEELYYGCIGVCEIGSLTTDFPVVKRLSIDNQFSYGEQMGMATYLDNIIRDVEDLYGYSFPSRTKLVQRIKSRDFVIRRIGEGTTDIKPIVDTYFTRAAMKMVDLIKKRWKKYPDIQCFYVMGGGATALRPYIMEAAGSLKLRFVEDSDLQNVFGYFKVAKYRLSQMQPVQE